jgi:hypothetical protein
VVAVVQPVVAVQAVVVQLLVLLEQQHQDKVTLAVQV